MARCLVFTLLIAVWPTAVALANPTNNCLTCHQEFEDEDGPSWKFERDVHGQRGIFCADCHGGDPGLEDMDEVREVSGYRGVPDYGQVPQFCAARCSQGECMLPPVPSIHHRRSGI